MPAGGGAGAAGIAAFLHCHAHTDAHVMNEMSTNAIPLVTLLALLVLATSIDLQENRIPNWLTGTCVASALLFAAIGIGQQSIATTLAGMAIGLVGLLPLYVLSGTSAGDVKLMAAAGAFLGPVAALLAVAASLAIGAVLTIIQALLRRRDAMRFGSEGVAIRRMRVPFAPSIAIGAATIAIYQALFL
jgi:prepilin peptidase CpaA